MKKHLTVFLALIFLMVAPSCSRDPNVVKRRYLETGNKYFDRGRYKEASIMYRSALKQDLRYGEAYYRLGLTQLKLDQHTHAVRSFRRAVELLPDGKERDDATARLADIYLAAYLTDPRRPRELAAEIQDLAERMLKRNANSFDGLRLQGYLAWREGNVKQAIEKFEQANRAKPMDPDVVLALSQALAEDNRFEEGEKLAKELIARKQFFGPIYDALYLQYARRQRMAEAEAIRRLKVDNNPKNAEYLKQLAQHYYVTNRRQEAAQVLERMLSNPKEFPNRLRDAGDFYASFREFDKAISYYEQGAAAGDSQQELFFKRRIADMKVAQGKRHEAAKFVDELLKQYPNDSNLLAMRASLLLDVGTRDQLQTAVNELQASVTRLPNNPVLRYNLGRAHWAKGEIEQARTQFREAVQMRPDYLAPRVALAQLHLNKGEWAQALQAAEEILALHSGDMHAHLIRASAMMGMGNHQKAREELQNLVNRNPGSREALYHLGRMELQLRQYEEAERTFLQCREDAAVGIRCMLGLVESYAARGQSDKAFFDKAFEVMNAEVKKSPNSPDLQLALANLAVQAAKYDVAEPIYKRLLVQDPKSSDLHIRLGETYRRKGDTQAAIEHFRKGKDLRPNEPAAYYPLAILLTATGGYDEAMKLYEQVLRLQPDNPIALNNLAYLMTERGGDLDLALTYAQRAKQKYPKSLDISDTLGWIYIKKNLTAQAVDIYKELVTAQPQNSTFRYHLAMALFQKGDKPQARKELQAALRNNPPKEEEAKIRDLMARIG